MICFTEGAPRRLAIGLLATLFCAGDIAAEVGAAKPDAPILMVANRSSHTVAFLDIGSGEILRTTRTGAGPHLLSNVDNGRVIATGFGEFPDPHDEPVDKRPPFVEELNSTLTVIDVVTGSILREWQLEDCARPHASWIVGNRSFVTCQDEKAVLEIDLESGKSTRRLDTAQEGTHVLGFEPRARVLAATNTDSGSITLINIDTGEIRTVVLAGGSEGMTVIDGQFWVANGWEGSVSIVDATSGELVAHTEPLCNFPIALSTNDRRLMWVACFGSGELVALDRDNHGVVERFKLEAQPLHVLLHPHRDLAYVSLPRENAVGEVDLKSGTVLRRIRTGIEPDGLRWAHMPPEANE